MPDTQTVQYQEGCIHNPISFCSPSLKTTDTPTETNRSKPQLLVLLLFMGGQEKSLVLLGTFMSICTLQGYSYFLCGVFHPNNKGIPTALSAKCSQALSTELSEPQDTLLHLVCTS